MSQYLTSKYIPSTITSKGQVTIPAAIRRYLGVQTNDKIGFVITPKGDVLLTAPQYKSIADLKGAAGHLVPPLSENELEEIAVAGLVNAATKAAV